MPKNNKSDEPEIGSNSYLDILYPEKTYKITRADLAKRIERLHGNHLAKLFFLEWEIQEYQEVINNWESEHGNDLALVMQIEAHKILLNELNTALTSSAAIYKKDLSMAESVQRSLLFEKAPLADNYDIAFAFNPLSKVSGDFYDFYMDNNNLSGLMIGDVSGHGIASALFTVVARPIFFRYFTRNMDKSLSKILELINGNLIEQMSGSYYYMTAVMLRFTGNNMEYANAAHPNMIQAVAIGNRFEVQPVTDAQETGTLLGLSELQNQYKSFNYTVNTNDLIVLYTDCLAESKNAADKEFGMDMIYDAINDMKPSYTSQEILDGIMDRFKKHLAESPIKDDLTVIVLKKK
jgi:sigma-B regulation protein RsbU (phosphoserine phosphatase)